LKIIDYKIPEGKMLKIKLEFEGRVIKSIRILGDFFLHPESTIDEIEERMIGCEVSIEQISSKIQNTLDENNAELIGASALDIANAIMKAFGN
jgi:lipoate-protein ligase A